jgi:nucleotide-binding universal stress UspA family protein
MDTIMVVFSATSISEKIAGFAIERAAKEGARLLLLDVRDRDISRKVSEMTGDMGFMGSKVTGQLQEEIKIQRERIITKSLQRIEKRAQENGVEIEVQILKGPSSDKIVEIAKSRGVSTLIVQKRMKDSDIEAPFQVIRLKR